MGSSPPRNPIYAASTLPATVAIPPVINKKYSDLFILFKYPLTNRGASVCPKKIFPATAKLSCPDILRNLVIIQANPDTTFCIMR